MSWFTHIRVTRQPRPWDVERTAIIVEQPRPWYASLLARYHKAQAWLARQETEWAVRTDWGQWAQEEIKHNEQIMQQMRWDRNRDANFERNRCNKLLESLTIERLEVERLQKLLTKGVPS